MSDTCMAKRSGSPLLNRGIVGPNDEADRVWIWVLMPRGYEMMQQSDDTIVSRQEHCHFYAICYVWLSSNVKNVIIGCLSGVSSRHSDICYRRHRLMMATDVTCSVIIVCYVYAMAARVVKNKHNCCLLFVVSILDDTFTMCRR